MWVNHKSRFEFVHVRLGEWLGWPQASPREPLRCPISSLVIVETLKYSWEETQTSPGGYYWSPVNENSSFDFEGSYLKRLGESIAFLLHIRPHKVRLDPRSIKNPMLRLDWVGRHTASSHTLLGWCHESVDIATAQGAVQQLRATVPHRSSVAAAAASPLQRRQCTKRNGPQVCTHGTSSLV